MKKLITILFFTASTSAFADYPIYPIDEITKFSNDIGTERIIVSKAEKALTTVQNLREAQAIADITGQFENALAELVMLSRIYNTMRDSEDRNSIESGLIYVKRLVYQGKCEELIPLLDLPTSRLTRKDLIDASHRAKVKIAQSCEYVAKWNRTGSK